MRGIAYCALTRFLSLHTFVPGVRCVVGSGLALPGRKSLRHLRSNWLSLLQRELRVAVPLRHSTTLGQRVPGDGSMSRALAPKIPAAVVTRLLPPGRNSLIARQLYWFVMKEFVHAECIYCQRF